MAARMEENIPEFDTTLTWPPAFRLRVLDLIWSFGLEFNVLQHPFHADDVLLYFARGAHKPVLRNG